MTISEFGPHAVEEFIQSMMHDKDARMKFARDAVWIELWNQIVMRDPARWLDRINCYDDEVKAKAMQRELALFVLNAWDDIFADDIELIEDALDLRTYMDEQTEEDAEEDAAMERQMPNEQQEGCHG